MASFLRKQDKEIAVKPFKKKSGKALPWSKDASGPVPMLPQLPHSFGHKYFSTDDLTMTKEILDDIFSAGVGCAKRTPSIAGGWVRDHVVGYAPKDVDIFIQRNAGRINTKTMLDRLAAVGWGRPNKKWATNALDFPGGGVWRDLSLNARGDALVLKIREIVKYKLPSFDVDLIFLRDDDGCLDQAQVPSLFDIRACQVSAMIYDGSLKFYGTPEALKDIKRKRLVFSSGYRADERAAVLARRFKQQYGDDWTIEVEVGNE